MTQPELSVQLYGVGEALETDLSGSLARLFAGDIFDAVAQSAEFLRSEGVR